MIAKEYLSQYRNKKLEAKRLKDEIKELEALSEYVSPRLSAGGIGISDKVGNSAAKIADKKRELEHLIDKALELMDEIEACINRVENPRLRYILFERYISCRKWEDIAEELNYTVRQIHRLHGRALQKMSLNVTIQL